jgi:hypothetical protein
VSISSIIGGMSIIVCVQPSAGVNGEFVAQ